MTTLPRRTPGATGQRHAIPEPRHGMPSRELRKRAAAGWERFLRRIADEESDREGVT
ncbi:hypothetical protein [Streptomyces sp. NPDC052494]|uniref:hypothetical protein n=1 Tax=Streptomyces sp. NPDC052494 TaxID=3365692 RepID=UPI0037CFC9E7